MAVGFVDGALRLYKLPEGSLIWEQLNQKDSNQKPSRIVRVTFSPDGKSLAACHANVVQLWQVSDGHLQKTINGPVSNVPLTINRIAFSPTGRYLVSAGSNGQIGLFDIRKSKGSFYKAHIGGVLSVNFDVRGQRLVSTGEDGATRLWQLTAWQPMLLKEVSNVADDTMWAAFSPD